MNFKFGCSFNRNFKMQIYGVTKQLAQSLFNSEPTS